MKIFLDYSKKLRLSSLYLKWFTLLITVSLLIGCSGFWARGDLSGARKDVVMGALAQIGTPYRYGGANPDQGFDCSGLVQYAHLNAGIRVPRATGAQKKSSTRIRKSRRQAGDLVFFRIGFRTYHVGILVDDERFVHAPSSGKRVQLTRLDNPYWAERFSATKTFLN